MRAPGRPNGTARGGTAAACSALPLPRRVSDTHRKRARPGPAAPWAWACGGRPGGARAGREGRWPGAARRPLRSNRPVRPGDAAGRERGEAEGPPGRPREERAAGGERPGRAQPASRPPAEPAAPPGPRSVRCQAPGLTSAVPSAPSRGAACLREPPSLPPAALCLRCPRRSLCPCASPAARPSPQRGSVAARRPPLGHPRPSPEAGLGQTHVQSSAVLLLAADGSCQGEGNRRINTRRCFY